MPSQSHTIPVSMIHYEYFQEADCLLKRPWLATNQLTRQARQLPRPNAMCRCRVVCVAVYVIIAMHLSSQMPAFSLATTSQNTQQQQRRHHHHQHKSNTCCDDGPSLVTEFELVSLHHVVMPFKAGLASSNPRKPSDCTHSPTHPPAPHPAQG